MSPKNPRTEDAPNTDKKKSARRVSFAENTTVRLYQLDEEYETPPEPRQQQQEDVDDELAQFNRELGFLLGDNDNNNNDGEGDAEREVFFRPVESSPASTAGSATSNDEDNFYGPVSSSFIRPGRLSDSGASDAHEITMDSTAFSQHFRSLAKSDSGGDLKTPTGVPLSFEETTPSVNTNPGIEIGSSMLLNLAKKPKSASSMSLVSGGSGSDDMSLVEKNPKKYDYASLSFGWDDLHADEIAPFSNKNIVTPSPIHLQRTSPSKTRRERIEPNNLRDKCLGQTGINSMEVEIVSVVAEKLDDPNGHREKLEHNQMGNGNLGHTETDHVITEVVPFADKLDDGNVYKESMELNGTSTSVEKVDQTLSDRVMVEVAPVGDKLVGPNGGYFLSPKCHPTLTSADEPNQYSDLLIKGMLSTKEPNTSELRPDMNSRVENYGATETQEGEMPQLDEFLQPHNESSLTRSLSSLYKQRQTVIDRVRESNKLLPSTPQNHVFPSTDGNGRRAETVPSVQKSLSKLRMLEVSPFAPSFNVKVNSVLMSSEFLYRTPPGNSSLYKTIEDAHIKHINDSAARRDPSLILSQRNKEINTISNMKLYSVENLINESFPTARVGISNFENSPAPRSVEVLASEQSSDLAQMKSLLFNLSESGKNTKRNLLTSEDPTGKIVVTPGGNSFLAKVTCDHQKIKRTDDTPSKSVHSIEKSLLKKSASKEFQAITSKEVGSKILVDQGYDVDRRYTVNASLPTTIIKELDSAFREIAQSSPSLSETDRVKETSGLETTSGLVNEVHNAQGVRLEGSPQPHLATEDSRHLILNGNLETAKQPELNKGLSLGALKSYCVSPPSTNKEDSGPSSLKKLIETSSRSPSRKRFRASLHEVSPAVLEKQLLNANQIAHENEDLSARKRTREDVTSGVSVSVDEMNRLQRSPKVHKAVGHQLEVLSGHHNGSSTETSTVGQERTLQYFTDALSELLAKKMLLPSTDQLHLQGIGELEDKLVKLQRLQTYEMHHSFIKSQKSVDNLTSLQHKRTGEAKTLLHRILHKHAKLQLMRLKEERLQKNVQLLRHGIQEAQLLKLDSAPLVSAECIRDANINGSHCQSIDSQGRKEKVPGEKAAELRQLHDSLESKITSLTKSVHSSSKWKGTSSHIDTVSAVNGYLKKKACCKFLRSDVQLWKVQNIFTSNGNRGLVLSYLDFVMQRITIIAGSASSILISNELNDGSMSKTFPGMDACTALTFSLNRIAMQKNVGSPSLMQETQITSSVLGNLLDVAEEVQQARLELQILTYTRFVSPSAAQLDLHFHFIGRKSGRKAVLTLDMSCLKWGIYPSTIMPCKLECSSEQLSAEIKAAIQSLGVGFSRILRICKTVSRVVEASSG